MKQETIAFRARTKALAVAVLQAYKKWPSSPDVQIIAKQAIRSGTSVAANYREACRARTTAEFLAKIGVCEQEADETQLWMELLDEGCGLQQPEIATIWKECDEIIAMLVSTQRTTRENSFAERV